MTPYHWLAIGSAALAVVQILAFPQPWTGLYSWATSGKSATTVAADKPTAQQAFAALEVLFNYKANCKDNPAYTGVQAAIKAQLEAP